MKVAILTLRLHINYGGILQAYALMEILQRLGHEPWLISNQPFTEKDSFFRIFPILKKAFSKIVLRKKDIEVFREKRIRKEYQTLYRPTRAFIDKYIQPQTCIVCTENEWRQLQDKYRFDAYIVGSDQVWRPAYANPIERYFFSFLKRQKDVKRLAYAASFGTDEWQFSDQETKRCCRLIQLFNGVSVREASGIQLCQEYLHCNAIQLLDPTLLLTANNYRKLLPTVDKSNQESARLLIYFLDSVAWKEELADKLQSDYALSSFRVNNIHAEKTEYSIEARKVPSVESWLDGFANTQYVITDSFHACVFSIIFHRPFWICGNEKRGMARFHSLLSMFGLEDRLINQSSSWESLSKSNSIDWNKIDGILEDMRLKSFDFLNSHLGQLSTSEVD